MRTSSTLILATLAGAIALAGTARAQDDYVNYIPNGQVNSCVNCHPGGNTGQLNGFGQLAANQSGKPPAQWWPALFDIDSDGDGQTNGEEMGDPCGDWLIGLDPPRTTAISNPGDPASKSADPDNPPCDAAGGAGGGAASGAGGDPTTGAGTTVGAGAGTGSGSGGSTPGAGSGGTPIKSTGAGRADPPLTTPGSCAASGATNPATRGSLWDIGFLAGAALALARHRRRKRS